MRYIPVCRVCKAYLYKENKSDLYKCRQCGREVAINDKDLEIKEEKEF